MSIDPMEVDRRYAQQLLDRIAEQDDEIRRLRAQLGEWSPGGYPTAIESRLSTLAEVRAKVEEVKDRILSAIAAMEEK